MSVSVDCSSNGLMPASGCIELLTMSCAANPILLQPGEPIPSLQEICRLRANKTATLNQGITVKGSSGLTYEARFGGPQLIAVGERWPPQ